MTKRFRLYWLRETGSDMGTRAAAEDLDPAIRQRVLELAGADERVLSIHLPFMDSRESRRRAEALRGIDLVREADVIHSVPPNAAAALRDRAAVLLASHPAWMSAPDEFHPRYFNTWQRVAVALQKAFRIWIPEMYFRDESRYEDREAAFPMLVYAASRPCRGRPRTEFTYDVAGPEALSCALNLVGSSLQSVMQTTERHLYQIGRPELARRYAPRWYQDVLRAVQKRPGSLISLLGDEAAVVNAVVGLGTARKMKAVKPFARSATMALRSTYGEDLRPLAFRALEEATHALENRAEVAMSRAS